MGPVRTLGRWNGLQTPFRKKTAPIRKQHLKTHADTATGMARTDGVLTPLKNCCFTGALLGDHCGPWDEGGALKGRFRAERRPFVTTLQNAELNRGRNCSQRDTWTFRVWSKTYGILLGTQERQVRGVRGQLDQLRVGFAALIQHFGAEGGHI